ncbi:hypothetical protein N8T08_009602 [Aspergillus melleus]|uniref:Uncharacterized protein n=1 Tax=Aspergillus melleus TaxID=138277 RepID=A0ACC3ATE0_9EURO|nr:hypothetical protein N8T08_009602 [Aspergillus melleus]
MYERADYAGEVGASISCGANGTRWLEEWKVDINRVRTDWTGGHQPYYNFYRVDMHAMLMQSATGSGEGQPAVLKVNHVCETVDHDAGTVTFHNGISARHDLVIGADGFGSAVRKSLGIHPERKAATSTSYHCVILTAEVRRLGLPDMSVNNALEYWGGHGPSKIIFSACRDGEMHSFYTFFAKPTRVSAEKGWNFWGSRKQLLAPFPNLDPALRALLSHASDIKPWRLYVHSPYPQWSRGRTGLLGDAAHPMLPDPTQGACQAIEDAAALGIIFSPRYTFTADVEASARARENLSERIGFSSQRNRSLYEIAHERQKLTIEEVNEFDMDRHIATQAEAC